VVDGKKILILDENTASRNFLSNTFREKQYRVLEAPSGKDALIVAWRDEPDLILFDPVLSDLKEEEFISKLRGNARTRNTPLVALSSDPGPARRDACISAGVDEYLVKSAQALLSLDESIARIFDKNHAAEEPKGDEKEPGSLIVFLSAKGGTGTSSLCANVAMNIKRAQPEARVVVADLVLPIGSIGPIVGYEGKLNIVAVTELTSGQMSGDYFPKNLPKPELWQFQLLAGSPDPQSAIALKGDRVSQVVDTLRSIYDIVILDIGRALSRISLPLIQKADLIALIVSTDHSTVHLTQTTWKYLQSQGIGNQKMYTILNRALGLEGVTKVEAEAIIGLPIKTTMPYMGGNFALANNLNQPITTKYPTDTASIILKELAADMVRVVQRLRVR
jgi:MinD-like ATPase involved in chromosome partitioning or flagellar assembly/ActR/RegA family two-component response regulator